MLSDISTPKSLYYICHIYSSKSSSYESSSYEWEFDFSTWVFQRENAHNASNASRNTFFVE